MGGSLPNSTLARLAAAFFTLSALLGPLLRLTRRDPATPLISEWGALVFGLVALAAPWDRWPQRALHSVAAAGFALNAGTAFLIGANSYVHSVHFIMLFMWVGAALGPRVPLAWGLPAAAAYAVPLLLIGAGRDAIASVVVVIPACIFTGEAAAWLTAQLRSVERLSQARAQTMAGLVDATLALAASQESDELARLTALGSAEIYRADCALVLLDDESGGLRPAGAAGWKEHCLEALEDPAVAALLREAMEREDWLPADGTAALEAAFGLYRLRMLPLRGSGNALGVAIVGSFTEGAPVEQLTEYVARTLATQAGLGFERVQSAQVLRDESLRDPLTAIGNRRSAEAALAQLKPGDAIAIIDLDHFKRVNDNYGHAAGDRTLCALVDHLRCSVRGPDSIFRIGGEEFLVLLPGAGGAGLAVVRRLQQRWRAKKCVTSFSAGVAVAAAGETPEAAVARADGALYVAKREGRDRVVLEAGPDDELT
jgi:diguanylate cyclase (GGDEF)-like protein